MDMQCCFPVLLDGRKAPETEEIFSSFIDISLVRHELSSLRGSQEIRDVLETAWALTLRCYVGSDEVCFDYRDAGVEEMRHHVLRDETSSAKTLARRTSTSTETAHNTAICFQVDQDDSSAKFDDAIRLVVDLSNGSERRELVSSVSLYYSSDWLFNETATNVGATFVKALSCLLQKPHAAVRDLDLLSQRDYDQISDWNSNYPEAVGSFVHDIISEKSLVQPNSIAIHAWDGQLTYEELEDSTTRLAHYLMSLGVRPEVYVVTCFPKTIWMTVTMLAVLKAGGVCVPVDASQPTSRRESIIRSVQSTIAIVDSTHTALFDNIVPIVVTDISSLIAKLPVRNSPVCPELRHENAAFVVYTSGSTGNPKGIIQHHEGLSASAYSLGAAQKIDSKSRVLQFATWTFDASAGDILATLMRGGCVCIPSDQDRLSDLSGFIRRFNVTHACLTPTIASLLRPADVPCLQHVSLGGEPLTKDNLSVWADHVSLTNIFGVSECTNWCSSSDRLDSLSSPSNIGRTFCGLYWIVDSKNQNRLLPVGSVGELLIQGPNVTRGYLNEPSKTAQAFIEDSPFIEGRKPPWRIYKTGDLARYNSDGTIHFLGRRDKQVKLNGQRIDLAGIEHQIKTMLGKEAQIAVEIVSRAEAKVLTAFLFLSDSSHTTEEQEDFLLPMTEERRSLRKAIISTLNTLLPSHMIPSAYIFPSQIPMTSSAKMDRKKLSLQASKLSYERFMPYTLVDRTEKQQLSTPMEKKLQALWSKALGIPANSIGAQDGFFRLGGDSIRAMRLITYARDAGIYLTVADIFRNEHLNALASSASEVDQSAVIEITPFSLIGEMENVLNLKTKLSHCAPEVVEDVYPCTPLQEGLMALTIRDPKAYVAQFVFKLPNSVDITRFQAAWDLVVEKTAILRTRIVQSEKGRLYQVVTQETPMWRKHSSLDIYLKEDAQLSVTLGGSLSRYAIVSERDQPHYFVWTIHHSIYDGWSFPLMIELVSSVYESGLPPIVRPFNNYIKYLLESDTTVSDKFWRDGLAGVTQPTFPSIASRDHASPINKLLQVSFPNLPKTGSSVTMATVIRTAWALIVSRYSDSDDIVFGAMTMGRNIPIPGISEIIGPTIATVPVRVVLNRQQSVMSLLQAVQEQVIESIPFEQVGLQNIKRLGPDAQTACEFQNLLVVQSDESMDTTNNSIGLERLDLDDGVFHPYPLVLECTVKNDCLGIRAQYDSNVIPGEQVRRVVYQFRHVINQLINPPKEQVVADLELLSPEDRDQIQAWSQELPAAANICAHHAIGERVISQPEAPAVSAWDASFTYRELDRLSTKIANRLISLGIGPETFVALCFEKSAWAVVSMLAVMKSGGAFVPLDPSHPMSRRQEIIGQVRAKVLLTSTLQAHSQDWGTIPVVVANSAWADMPDTAPIAQCKEVQPNNTLYVIFTSGSTGKPKGFVIEHSAFCSAAMGQGRATFMDSQSRIFQFSSYSFDVSILEIVTGLIFGGCICISSTEASKDIAKTMRDMRVTWTCLTPSVVRLVQPQSVPDLKTLVLGGEAVWKTDIKAWSENVQLVLGYGPSECSVAATVSKVLTPQSDPDNFGHSVASVSWIVEPNDHNRLAPLGAVGEILIEGPILGRCYLNDEAKTSAAFIDGPQWLQEANSKRNRIASHKLRLYKSGDLGRFNPDGSVNFVARKDRQVKVRGQRVELQEVEHHFSKLPEVRHIAVEFPKLGPFKKKLVIVLSLQEIPLPDGEDSQLCLLDGDLKEMAAARASEICDIVSGTLPPYMIPTVRIVVKDMPFTPSGKINRRRILSWLEDLDDTIYRQIVGFDEEDFSDCPITELESSIRGIWSTVLNLKPEQISLTKPFFRLGGDSISAMQIMSLCRDKGIMVSVQDVIRCQTISKLAQNVNLDAEQKPTVFEEEFDTEFMLAPAQQLFFENAKLQTDARCNMSFNLRLIRSAPVESLALAVEKLVSRHSMLRARFKMSDNGRWTQSIPAQVAGSYRLEVHHVETEEQLPLIYDVSQKSLNICHGPVFSVDIILTNDGQQFLFLLAHHLVVDFVSWRIIILDLEKQLESTSSTPSSSLPFQTWCRLLADHCQDHTESGASLSLGAPIAPASYEYWGLENSTSNTQADAAECHLSMDKPTTQLLLNQCNDPLRTETIDMIIAALVFSFTQIFDDRDAPAVFNEDHGREPWTTEIDLSQTVGWFTTFSPIQIPIDPESIENPIATLYRVKDARRLARKNALTQFASRFQSVEGSNYTKDHFCPELVLNYGGLYQQLERKGGRFEQAELPRDMVASDFALTLPRISLLNIEAQVENGSLKVALTYNRRMRHIDRLGSWMKGFQATLQDFSHRLPNMNKHFTLHDFPSIPLDYSKLRKLFSTTLPERGWTEQDVEDVYACSPLQQGLLISQTKNQDDGLYQVRTSWEISSRQGCESIDIRRVQQAWQAVVERHSIMRTILLEGVAQEGIYSQVVLSKVQAPISRLNSSTYAEWRSSKKGNLGFDLSKPPHKLSIISLGDGRIFCELEISHTIIDGVSKEILLRDFRQAYDNTGRLDPGPPYREFIEHIQSISDSPAYWKEHLAGADPCYFPTLTDLVDEPKEFLQTEAKVDTSMATLQEFCTSQGITLSNLFQLVWALVLRCYTGSADICFGYMNSGRDTPIAGVQDAVGPLISMLVCRLALDDSTTARQGLQKLERDFVQSLPHQHCGLAQIQRSLGLQGEPLFNSGMSFRRTTAPHHDDKFSILFDNFDSEDPSEYDVVLAVDVSHDDINIVLNHWTSRLSKNHALNVMNTLNALLSRIVENPNRTIDQLCVLSDEDHNQIQKWNAEPPEFVEECIHTTFERQTIEQPRSNAVHAWDGELTYSELDQLSSKLACHIQSLGVGPETTIPLCFEKSMYVVVAMVAVLKAGGAIALLDSSHPISRLEQIISQVGAKFMLTSAQHSGKLRHCVDLSVQIDQAFLDSLPRSTGFQSNVTHRNAAYVVFTSGSTGTPKGIVIEHSAFASGAKQQARISRISSSSRVLQFASFGFDVSIMEIFTSLMFGACVCIPSDQARNGNVVDVLNDMQITWTFLTPSVVKLIRPEEVPYLETLILGGEPLTKLNVETWAEKLQLMNGYGPSECSVAAAAHRYVTRSTNSANIGEAIGGRCWIVNPSNYHQLTPIGAVGELVVQGPILARGYLGDSEKTRAAFVEDSVWLEGERWSRLYRTGDLMRYNSDGTLIFIGRKDTQVKLRGQRIELDEIEHHISSHGLIKHSMVALPSKGPCTKQIVAVISLLDLSRQATIFEHNDLTLVAGAEKNSAFSQVGKISDFMSDRVPSYMVPTVWVILWDLPLLPSGKLERTKVCRWLENMDQATFNQITEFEKQGSDQPLTMVEKKLQSIWSEVLGVSPDEIGPRRSFLNLGGDSIAAMQVVARCRAAQIELGLQDILRCKTISQLASHIEGAEDSEVPDTELEAPFNLFPSQNLQLSLANQINNQSGAPNLYNKSLLMRLEKPYPISDIAEAIEALVAQHPMLRARFKPNKMDPDKWSQHILPAGAESYRFDIHVVRNLEDAVPLLETSGSSLDIEQGPIFAADLIIVNIKELYLSFVAHQLAIDSSSWVTLMEDLQEILEQRTSSLRDPFSFQPFTRSLKKFGPQATAVRVVAPFDTAPADPSYWGVTERWQDPIHEKQSSFEIDNRSTSLLLGECNKVLRTQTTDLILGCLVHAFEEVFSDRKLPNMFIARNSRKDTDVPMDISNVVGCFETMYPLVIEQSAQTNIVDNIRQTKDVRRTFLGNSRPCFLYKIENSGIFETLGKLPTEIAFNDIAIYHQKEQKSRNLRSLKRIDAIGDRPVGSRVPGLALFDVVATLPNGCLRLSFTWSHVMKHQKGIHRWIQRCQELILLAIEKLLGMKAEYTTTDFPLLSYTAGDLHNLIDEQLSDVGIFDIGNVEDVYPCSPMQMELVRSQAKNCGFYEVETISEVISLDASRPVDPQRLQYAWELVVDRHAALRTLFIENNSRKGHFDQVVLSHITPRTVLLTSEEDEQVLDAFMRQAPIQHREPVPPHRLTICQTAQGNVFCKLEISHVIVDGTSVPLILHDLNLAYHGNLSTGKKPLYSSYIQYLQRKPHRGFEYWTSHLSQIQPCHMPVSLETKARAGEHRTRDLRRFSSARIRATCGNYSVTTSTLFHLVWALVLRRYVKTDSVNFGYLVSGREVPVPGIQDAVGLFFYTLVCHLRLETNSSLVQTLEDLQHDYIEALPYQSCDMSEVYKALDLKRPAFNTLVNFGKFLPAEGLGTGVEFHPLLMQDPMDYDIVVGIAEVGDSVQVSLRYWSPRIGDGLATEIGDTFYAILVGILEGDSLQTVGGLDSRLAKGRIEEVPLIGGGDLLQDSDASNGTLDLVE